MEILPQLLLIILLIFLNGFFVASEFALVAVRKTRIEELVRKKNTAAKLVQGALANLDSYISATQLGITIASLALGWIGEPILAGFFEPVFSFLPENVAVISSHTFSVLIAFLTITFFHIVFGELVPKNIALVKSEKVSLYIITPLIGFTKLFKPFIFILQRSGALVLTLLDIHVPTGQQLAYSKDEIRMILTQSGQQGTIPSNEVEMVYNVLKLGDIPIKQIMIPRTDIVAFKGEITLQEVVKRLKKTPHSRFPIYERSIDQIIGFVHIKDVFKEIFARDEDTKLIDTNLIREILHVPEIKRADEVLLDMRRKRIHLAVVNDEYGGTAGIVTLEDIIESLVGEIEDEFEKPFHEIRKLSDGTYFIDGLASVERVQEKFKLPMRGQGYTTIGGLVFGLLGREPHLGDEIQIGPVILTVEKMERKRIKTLHLHIDKKKKK